LSRTGPWRRKKRGKDSEKKKTGGPKKGRWGKKGLRLKFRKNRNFVQWGRGGVRKKKFSEGRHRSKTPCRRH